MRKHRSGAVHHSFDSRGYALATVLMIVGVILIISLGMTSVSMLQLNMAVSSTNQMKARMAAESELNKALFAFIRNPDFGKDGGSDTWSDKYTGTTGRVSFSQKESFFSTYNLENKTAVAGWNRTSVPPNSVHVIATGDCGNTRKCMEMIVKKELFPYALATTSRIETQNSPLWIEGVKDTASFLSGIKDKPGNIHSNHAAGIAIEAPAKSYINGTASAVGNISIGMPSDILGGIKPYSGAVEVPTIAVDSFDPKNTKGVIKIGKGSYTGLNLNSLHRCDGDIEINGNLEMKDAVLYTTGDLLVSGQVTGNGALMSKGKVTIGKTAALSATNQIAIIADKDVTVAGDPGKESYFQGLIYTHGNFYGNNFTLLGNLIAQSAEESKGKAVLKDMKIVYNEEATGITISTTVSTESAAPEGTAISRNWKGFNAHDHYYNETISYDCYTAITYRIKDREKFSAALEEVRKELPATTDSDATCLSNASFRKLAELDNYAETYSWTVQAQGGASLSETRVREMLSDPDKYIFPYTNNKNKTDLYYLPDAYIQRTQNGFSYISRILGSQNGDDQNMTYYHYMNMRDCCDTISQNIVDNPATSPQTDPQAQMIVTDLTLNKYLTKILPTRVTFQGEMP
ncbi:MAG: hypothetical protein AB9903_16995 [Vulcanimicrobiota bacterium]